MLSILIESNIQIVFRVIQDIQSISIRFLEKCTIKMRRCLAKIMLLTYIQINYILLNLDNILSAD